LKTDLVARGCLNCSKKLFNLNHTSYTYAGQDGISTATRNSNAGNGAIARKEITHEQQREQRPPLKCLLHGLLSNMGGRGSNEIHYPKFIKEKENCPCNSRIIMKSASEAHP
jgi:hypothetical protein